MGLLLAIVVGGGVLTWVITKYWKGASSSSSRYDGSNCDSGWFDCDGDGDGD